MSARSTVVWIWLAGAVGVCGMIGVGHARAARLLRGARQFSDARVIDAFQRAREGVGVDQIVTIAKSPHVPGPMLVGMIRPAIIMPRGLADRLDEEALELIFRHELAHVRRKDILVSWLWAIAAAVHWFNPLVWMSLRAARADRELACDARVLATLKAARRPAYGRTLLAVLESAAPAPVATGMAAVVDGCDDLSRRITMILSFAPASRTGVLTGLAALILAAAATLTAAQPAERPAPQAPPDMSARGEHRLCAQEWAPANAEGKLVASGGFVFGVEPPKTDDPERRITITLNGQGRKQPVLRSVIPAWQARFFKSQMSQALQRAAGKARARETRVEIAIKASAFDAQGMFTASERSTLQALPQAGSDPSDLKIVLYSVDEARTPLEVEVGPATMTKLEKELTAAMEKAGIPLGWDESPAPAAEGEARKDDQASDRFVFDIANRPAQGGWIVLPGKTTIEAKARAGAEGGDGGQGGLTLTFVDPEPGAPQRAPITLELSPKLAGTFVEQLGKAAKAKDNLEADAAKLAQRMGMTKEKVLEGIRADEARRSGPVVVNISPRTLRPDASGKLTAAGQELSVRPPGIEGIVDFVRVGIMISSIPSAPNSGGCTMVAYITQDEAGKLLRACRAALNK